MNKITSILNDISDLDLKIAMSEIKSKKETGVLGNGFVRELARKIRDEIGVDLHHALSIAEQGVLENAAFKFFDSTSKLNK